jgi:hypothetical protein
VVPTKGLGIITARSLGANADMKLRHRELSGAQVRMEECRRPRNSWPLPTISINVTAKSGVPMKTSEGRDWPPAAGASVARSHGRARQVSFVEQPKDVDERTRARVCGSATADLARDPA